MEHEILSPVLATRTPRRIAITGVSGLIGQRVLPLLEAIDGVEQIVGVDVREPTRRVSAMEFHLVDLVGGDLVSILKAVDVVVHLAGVVGPAVDVEVAQTVNIDGLKALLNAADVAKVGKLVCVSSAAVYGAWPQNAVPLTENDALRPNPGYQPALLDAECERIVANWHADHPEVIVTTLRCAPVVGSGATSVFARVAVGRMPAVVRGFAPPVQVLHVDDAASSIVHAVEWDIDGVFNVAADSWLDHDDAVAVAPHRRPPAVPLDVASSALAALWASGMGDAPPEVLPYVMHSWVVSNEKLKSTGWMPRHTNEEAILLAGDPDVRRRPLPWIAAVSAVLGGATAATWWLTRRRHR